MASSRSGPVAPAACFSQGSSLHSCIAPPAACRRPGSTSSGPPVARETRQSATRIEMQNSCHSLPSFAIQRLAGCLPLLASAPVKHSDTSRPAADRGTCGFRVAPLAPRYDGLQAICRRLGRGGTWAQPHNSVARTSRPWCRQRASWRSPGASTSRAATEPGWQACFTSAAGAFVQCRRHDLASPPARSGDPPSLL